MLPKFIPMPLVAAGEPFDHADWVYEVKWDGAWNAITSPLHTWHRHHFKHLDRSTGRTVMRVILQQIGHGVLGFPLDDRKPRDLAVALANG